MSKIKLMSIKIIINGRNHLAHFSQGILATPRTAMVTPEVGRIGFINSQSWKAMTAVCRVTPTRSLSGAIMGIVNVAWAVPECIKKVMADCVTNIICATMILGKPEIILDA